MEGDIFGLGETPEAEVVDVVQEQVAPEPAEQPSEPAAVEEVPQGTVTTPEPKAEPGFIPISAVLDEREKRKAAEQELERLRAAQAPKSEPIDPWTNLEGAFETTEQKFQTMLHQQKVDMSRRFAEIQHGKDEVEAAIKWAYAQCDSDPAFNAKVYHSPDPVGFAVEAYRKDQIASTVTMDDFKAFQAWKAAQANPQPIPAQPAPSPAPTPPRSLATAPSAGSPTPPKNDPAAERLASMF